MCNMDFSWLNTCFLWKQKQQFRNCVKIIHNFIKKTVSCYPITKETMKHCQLNLNYRSWAGIVVYFCNLGGRQRQMDQSLFEVNCVYTTGYEFEWPNYSAAQDCCFQKLCSELLWACVSVVEWLLCVHKSWLQSPGTAENIYMRSFKNRNR